MESFTVEFKSHFGRIYVNIKHPSLHALKYYDVTGLNEFSIAILEALT